jgi:hypothetical protein
MPTCMTASITAYLTPALEKTGGRGSDKLILPSARRLPRSGAMEPALSPLGQQRVESTVLFRIRVSFSLSSWIAV